MGTSYVVDGAKMSCPRGSKSSSFKVPAAHDFSVNGKNAANIGDSKPMVNIQPFGMCKVPPPVNQIPCACAVAAPWIVGKPDFLVDGMPALTSDAIAICTLGGVIKFEDDGQ